MLNEMKSRYSGLSETKSRFSGKSIKTLLLLITFFISTSIIQAQNYDYLIITSDSLNGSWNLQLRLLQTSRGFHPEGVTIPEGADTTAIRNIIADFYNNNPGYAKKYVLLVGNAMNDPAGSPINFNNPYNF